MEVPRLRILLLTGRHDVSGVRRVVGFAPNRRRVRHCGLLPRAPEREFCEPILRMLTLHAEVHMTNLDRACLEAIRHLEAAKALVKQVPLHSTAITVHFIEVARKHVHATRKDIRREL